MSAGLNITIKVNPFPQADFMAEAKTIMQTDWEPKIQSAMQTVAEATKKALRDHIQKDVYDKWDPVEYRRRRYDDGMIDLDLNISDETATSMRLMLEYNPIGEHLQWEQPLNGDGMIRRIETGKGYEWSRHPGPRPFWTNFVNEMVDSKFAEEFDAAMAMQFGADYVGGTVTERDGFDGQY